MIELKDMGYIIIIEDEYIRPIKNIIVRDVMRPSGCIELPWSELKEYALRIKDYLGDKYLSFSWRKVVAVPTRNNSQGFNPYKKVELNEDTEIDDRIWAFVIKYKGLGNS